MIEDIENGLNPIRIYKTNKVIRQMRELPIKDEDRIQTDVFCTVITAIFALAMFAMAIVCLRVKQLQKITYPTDGQGRHCTLDHRSYNYLYFTSQTDPNKRLCVSQCPKGNQTKIKCWPSQRLSCSVNQNKQFQVEIYATVPQETALGLFCLPEDKTVKQKIIRNARLVTRFQFVKIYRTIWVSALITLLLGITYLILLSNFTTQMVYSSIFLGGLGSLGIGICFLILPSNLQPFLEAYKIIFCTLIILIGLIILSSLIKQYNGSKDIRLCIIFLHRAYDCLKTFKLLALLIPLFIFLMFGLTILFGFQLFSYWSRSQIKFYPNQVYNIPQGHFATITTILNFIELIWGFSFLKQTFSFLVSGSTITYFFWKQHYFKYGVINFFKYHWGSVAAGSFLLIFFYIFDIIYDLLKPQENNQPCHRIFLKMCCCCQRILGLVRSQSMAYINITGVPYCNASRWCQRMSLLSTYFNGSQSINRYFRMGSHVLISMMGTIYSVFTMEMERVVETPHVPALIFNFILNMFIVTFFISLPADIAQAMFTCFLIQKYLENDLQDPDSAKPNTSRYENLPTHFT